MQFAFSHRGSAYDKAAVGYRLGHVPEDLRLQQHL